MGNCDSSPCGPSDGPVKAVLDREQPLVKQVANENEFDLNRFEVETFDVETATPDSAEHDEGAHQDFDPDADLEQMVVLRRKSRKFTTTRSDLGKPVKTAQEIKLSEHNGLFVNLALSPKNALEALKIHGHSEDEFASEDDIMSKMDELTLKVLQDEHFDGSRITGAIFSPHLMNVDVKGRKLPDYLWHTKGIVPLTSKEIEMQDEKKGQSVQLVDEEGLGELCDAACTSRVFGVKIRSKIMKPILHSIQIVVDQMCELAKQIITTGLGVILQCEVDYKAGDKALCEDILIERFMYALESFSETEKIMLMLTLPTRPGLYMPLVENMNTLCVLASPIGLDRIISCQMLAKNPGMKACFGRPFLQAMDNNQPDDEFSDALDESCRTMLEATRVLSTKQHQMFKTAQHEGFFAGFDTTGPAVKGALQRYGFDVEKLQSDAELGDAFQQVRARIIAHPRFNSYRVIGAVLSEQCVERQVDGVPTAKYLWDVKKVVPMMSLDRELATERNGVQLMKNVTKLAIDPLIAKCSQHGIFGAKAFSLIKTANAKGIKELVRQHITLAKHILSKHLVPIIAVEVSAAAENKKEIERLLLDALLQALGGLGAEEKVMLELTIPSERNAYLPLIGHPHTLRVTGNSSHLSANEVSASGIRAVLQKNIGMCGIFKLSFIKGLKVDTADEDFTTLLDEGCKEIYEASTAIPVREEQIIKVTGQDGFFAALDQTGNAVHSTLQQYGVNTAGMDAQQVASEIHNFRVRILTNPSFNGSRVVSVSLAETTMNSTINDLPAAKYLWQEKSIVPFVKIDKGLNSTENGVNLLKEIPKLDALLTRARKSGIFGLKVRSVIRSANSAGIKALVQQQFDIAKKIFAKDLIPILQPEVDISARDRIECEQMLYDLLLDHLDQLASDQRLLLLLSLPAKVNHYFPLIGHPNVIRLLALSGGFNQAESCQMLADNTGMIACFSRALFENNKKDLSEKKFTQVLEDSCLKVFQASRALPVKEQQMIKVRLQNGFWALFDQSALRLPDVLESYGLKSADLSKSGSSTDRYPDEKVMLAKFFELCVRIFTNPMFNGSRIIGASLSRDTMNRTIGSQPTALYLWDHCKVIAFLSIDVGLKEEEGGVRLMKDIPELDTLLDKAIVNGVRGTTTRAMIRLANNERIAALVEQQFKIGRLVIARGMIPVMQMEVDIRSPEKASAERILRLSVQQLLNTLQEHEKIILMFSPPERANTYLPLMRCKNVLRTAFVSGGHNIEAACRMVAQNTGVVASFGRAFVGELKMKQTEKEFTRTLVDHCKMMYDASRVMGSAEGDPGASDTVGRLSSDRLMSQGSVTSLKSNSLPGSAPQTPKSMSTSTAWEAD